MRTHAFGLALASVSFITPIQAQEARHAVEQAPGASVPVATSQIAARPSPGTPLPALESKNRLLAVGEGKFAELDDAVPLPGRAVVSPGPDGDAVVSAAEGDPYFLSFAGAALYPPANEHVDPALVRAASDALSAGRKETYAFVMFNKRMTPARVAALEALGIQTLSFHPHYCLKVKIPVLSIDACSALDFVRWVGVSTPP